MVSETGLKVPVNIRYDASNVALLLKFFRLGITSSNTTNFHFIFAMCIRISRAIYLFILTPLPLTTLVIYSSRKGNFFSAAILLDLICLF